MLWEYVVTRKNNEIQCLGRRWFPLASAPEWRHICMQQGDSAFSRGMKIHCRNGWALCLRVEMKFFGNAMKTFLPMKWLACSWFFGAVQKWQDQRPVPSAALLSFSPVLSSFAASGFFSRFQLSVSATSDRRFVLSLFSSSLSAFCNDAARSNDTHWLREWNWTTILQKAWMFRGRKLHFEGRNMPLPQNLRERSSKRQKETNTWTR